MDDARGTVTVLVPANTFRPRPDRFIVIAPYLPREMRLGPVVWILRADEFARLAHARRGQLVFQGSPRPNSRDRWSRHRYAPREVAGLFEATISARLASARAGRVGSGPAQI